MKKAILTLIGLFLISGSTFAQVIADFESDANGFADNGWGNGFTGVARVADPTGKSSGVLELTFNGGGEGRKGAIQKDNVDPLKGQLFTMYIWLPTNVPNGLDLKLWAQDNGSWSWNEQLYKSDNIPREVWYPLNFYMEQKYIANPGSFNHKDYKLGKMGIEIANWNVTDKSWTGKIYIDNVGINGAEPNTIAGFETDLQNYKQLWGSIANISRVADPSGKSAGVAALQFNNTGGAFGLEAQTDASKGNLLVIWVWLPAGVADADLFKVFMQDNKDWAWNAYEYTAGTIPKEKWYPLYFDMAAVKAKPGSKFDHIANKIGKFGFEFVTSTFAGTMYVDNIGFISTETGEKWVLTDFESLANPTGGFTIPSWGPSITKVENAVEGNTRVLKATLDLSKGINNNTEGKGVIQKDNIVLYSSSAGKSAKAISIDVFVPSDIPLGAQLSIAYSGSATTGWLEDKYMIDDLGTPTSFPRGRWSSIVFNAESRITSGEISDPTKPATVYIQIYYEAVSYAAANKWLGSVLFDNLTLIGIPQPQGSVVSPATVGTVVTYTMQNGVEYQYMRFDWEDNKLGTETYNIYMSEKPITNLDSPDVKKVVGGIPHGLQKYAYRPRTSDGSTKTYYFAITAFDGSNETALSDQCKVGPVQIKTSPTYKVQYVKDFATKFVLDGIDDEFTAYKADMITPESGTYAIQGEQWTPNSTDMNFKATFVIDDNYIYLSAVVDDDDLRRDDAAQAWEGDALEFYMGFYNARYLKAPHPKNSGQTDGDWRIGFNSDGKTTLGGTDPVVIDGVEATVFQKFTGDGYIIEAKMELKKLGPSGVFKVENGMWLPLRIDGNDMDPSKGDTQRSLIVQAGGTPTGGEVGGDEDWKRPDAWGFLEVVNGPVVDVAEENMLPKEYALHNNYPNPFNPTTTIKYDLPKESQVLLKVYDVLGREVATLINQNQKPGYYEVTFNAARLATGIYIYRIIANDFVQTKKMLLVK